MTKQPDQPPPARCRHQARITRADLLTLSPVFSCRHCGELLEPARGWRRLRLGLNVAGLLALILVIFQPLRSDFIYFLKMLAETLAVVAAFWGLSYALLRLARYETARPEVKAAVRSTLKPEPQSSEAQPNHGANPGEPNHAAERVNPGEPNPAAERVNPGEPNTTAERVNPAEETNPTDQGNPAGREAQAPR
ncbi:MAG: hypothetical protein PHR21_04490 [Oscillospiraceae bacterium]|nr:hypothetical protein [Oscillospiraceae bacterium]